MPNGRTLQKVGQDVHSTATELLESLKATPPNERLSDIDRVYSEVRVDKGSVTQIGGKPGGSKGALNPDLVGVKKGEVLSKGDTLQDVAKKTEAVGDIKAGGGKIAKKYEQLGGRQVTVNGVTSSSATDPALLKAAKPQHVPSSGKIAAKESTENAKLIGAEGKEALSLTAKAGSKEALSVAKKTGIKEGAKVLGTRATKFVPFVGIGVGAALVAKDLKSGDYASAAWDAAEAIPVVGDVVGAGHLGIGVGGAVNEGLGIDKVASEHGSAVERAAKTVGLSTDTAQLIGATGAAISSITIAPTIAIQRKISSWFK